MAHINETPILHKGTAVNDDAAAGITGRDIRLSAANLFIAFIALLIGGFAGLLQGLVRSGFLNSLRGSVIMHC